MDLTYDFLIDHVNPHIYPEDVTRLRCASPDLKHFKILPHHKFIRKLTGNNEILNFKKNEQDYYELSVSLSENFNKETFKHLKKIIVDNPLNSFSIYYYEKNINRYNNLFYNTDFNLLYELLYSNKNSDNFRYLSMCLNDFWRFSDVLDKQIISENYINFPLNNNRRIGNFDTLHVDFRNWEIQDLSHLGYTILKSYPFIKTIIIDKISVNKYDLNRYFLKAITEHINNGNLNLIIDESMGNSEECDPKEISYCHDFKYDYDKYPLIKTQYMGINIYHYDRFDTDPYIDQLSNEIIIDYLVNNNYDNYLSDINSIIA